MSSAIATMVRTVSFFEAALPAAVGHKGANAVEEKVLAQSYCSVSVWNGQSFGEVPEQVQHREREVPLPVGSTLLTGKRSSAETFSNLIQSNVRLLNSMSLDIHQAPMSATLPG